LITLHRRTLESGGSLSRNGLSDESEMESDNVMGDENEEMQQVCSWCGQAAGESKVEREGEGGRGGGGSGGWSRVKGKEGKGREGKGKREGREER